MVKVSLSALLIVVLIPLSASGEPLVTEIKDLNNAKTFDAVSIFGTGSGGASAVLGDTYTGAPLVQNNISAFLISDTVPSTQTFDEASEDGGVNLAGPADTRFEVNELVVTAGNVQTVIVEWTSVDAARSPTPWVGEGEGPFFSWRLDVGTEAGAPDTIEDPLATYIAGSGRFSVFNRMGAPLGTFALGNPPAAGDTELQGIAVIGLGPNVDIAGFDMASIQMAWDMTVVPEPSAIGLLAVGCCACLGTRRMPRNRVRGD